MENNELDNAAESLTPSDTQTVEPTAEKLTEQEPVQPTDNSQAPVQKTSKYDTIKKSYDELRSYTDRKNNEYVQKIQALEKKMQNYAPYEQYLPQLGKALEEKRKAELQQQYQQDPLTAQQQLMEQMLNERLAPLQQQQAMVQNEQVVNQSIDYMKQTYGEEAFKEVSPYMGQILENTRAQYGEQIADVLARNPDHLFKAAFGELALNKIKEFNLNKQAGTQSKVQLAQQSAGISRPNKTARTNSNGSDISQVEKNAFDFLQQNT